MHREILEFIAEKTAPEFVGEMQETIMSMVCNDNQPMPLSEEKLYEALRREGEFLVLKLTYGDLEREREEQKIKRKITQSLSVLAVFEDDGRSLGNIEKSVKYMHDLVEEKQNFLFGIKRVERLSEFPVTTLFSGILPINQLELYIGEEIDRLIHSDDEHFTPRFRRLREDISETIGIPILPVFTTLDTSLPHDRVRLVQSLDGSVIAEFDTTPHIDRESLEIYLLKLFYIYKQLGRQMREQLS